MTTHNTKIIGEGLTYDDVLLVPNYSEVLPREVSIQSKFSRNITLNVPILTAAMDTVTEAAMAIAIAREGGIGVLHKNMSIEMQAQEVRKVKRSESGLIIDPVTLTKDESIATALSLMNKHKIGGIPVIDKDNKLMGIITNRDLRFCRDLSDLVADHMTDTDIITAPEGTTLNEAEEILDEHKIEKLPVVDASNTLVGLITYKDILKVKNYPHSSKDEFGRLRVAAAVGVTSDMIERIQALVDVDVDFVCIDTAHGHSKGVLDA